MILLGLVSVTGMPYVVLMPIFADKILHKGGQEFASLIGSHDLGAVRLGILMGAAGVGALLGALTLAVRSGVKGLGRWISVCCAGFGVSLMLFSFSKSFWLSVLLLLPVGYFIMLQMASSNTLIQVMVPDALRGPDDGGVFHDVHGHGPGGCVAGRGVVRSLRRADHGSDWRLRFGDRSVVVQRAVAEDSGGSEKTDRCAGDGRRRTGRGDVDAGGGGVTSSARSLKSVSVSRCAQ